MLQQCAWIKVGNHSFSYFYTFLATNNSEFAVYDYEAWASFLPTAVLDFDSFVRNSLCLLLLAVLTSLYTSNAIFAASSSQMLSLQQNSRHSVNSNSCYYHHSFKPFTLQCIDNSTWICVDALVHMYPCATGRYSAVLIKVTDIFSYYVWNEKLSAATTAKSL